MKFDRQGGGALASAEVSRARVSRDFGQDRILFLLSTKERELFLPEESLENVAGVEAGFFPSCEHSEDDWLAIFGELRPTIAVTNWSSRPFPECVLREAGCRLRYVCHMAGTVRRLVPRSFLEKGGVVSNWGGMAARQVAEHALLLALSVLRGQGAWRAYMKRPRTWHDWPTLDIGTRTLFFSRVGIHGFGNVARTLAGLLKPFGGKVSAWSEGVPESLYAENGVRRANSLEDLFASSEILFECEALNERTRESVGANLLARLPDDAIFVNVGRGQVVREEALLDEVRSGRISAGLDVLSDESDVASSPFLHLPNAILSPHIAGPTKDQYPALGRSALLNIERFLSGGEPDGLVTLENYDRST